MSEPGEPGRPRRRASRRPARRSAKRSGPPCGSSSSAFPGSTRATSSSRCSPKGSAVSWASALTPARVIACGSRKRRIGARPVEEPGTPAALLREFLEPSARARRPRSFDPRGRDELVARLSGPDVGLLIGKRGQTIDSIQHLANALGRRRARSGSWSSTPRATAPGAGHRSSGWPRTPPATRSHRRAREARADAAPNERSCTSRCRSGATSRPGAKAPSPTAASSSRPRRLRDRCSSAGSGARRDAGPDGDPRPRGGAARPRRGRPHRASVSRGGPGR